MTYDSKRDLSNLSLLLLELKYYDALVSWDLAVKFMSF